MILTIFTILLLIVTIGGFFNTPWWFTIFDFFRLQYALLAIVGLTFSLFFGRYDLALLHTAIIAVNFFRIRDYLPSFSSTTVYQDKDILSINAWKENQNPENLNNVIKGANPQILLIMEMTDHLEKALHDVLQNYPYRVESPVRDGFRICLLSKHKLEDAKVSQHGASKNVLLQAKCELYDTQYQIYSAHPKPALSAAWHKERLAYFKDISTLLEHTKLPVIMLGDFNSVPWESHFCEFTAKSKLHSTIKNHGYHITWPSYFIPMGIPMDHILLSQGINYYDLHIGPNVSSDHYPIALNLKSRA